MTFRIALSITILAASLGVSAALVQRSDAFGVSRDHPAISYSSGPVSTLVDRLNGRLRDGTARLAFDPATGYLRDALKALDIPVESQVLVFSQTSFQADLIAKNNPRAVYFSDGAAIGWVRGGDTLEVAVQDARQGTIFYTLRQSPTATPQLERDDRCLRCHLSWDTRAVPGPIVLTTHARRSENDYANGGFVDHREPIGSRWGGWYVTGKLVPARHMGNTAMLRPDAADPEHTPPAPRLTTLQGQFDLAGYPTPHSDVVALLVLEHQAHLANLLTRAGWEARLAAYQAHPGRVGEGVGTATRPMADRVRGAVDELVDYMLFVDEAPLAGAVAGLSGFAQQFSAQGPRDDQGRSLRDFDLNERLMRYPLSYMIYSTAFEGLPEEVKAATYERLWRILSGEDRGPGYAHLTLARRRAIVEILRATKPDLPRYFVPVTQ